MTIREMQLSLGCTQAEFSARYNIPLRTIQNWESGTRTPPGYILELLENQVRSDLINRRTFILPVHDTQKPDLPRRQDYLSARAWLRSVQDAIGSNVVFALDEALMCHGAFGGRNNESLIWVYGEDSVTRFNGVVVLGVSINQRDVHTRDGLRYTDFNRTILDALANESILDMQGITEALCRYYFSNNESFDGISIPPEYQSKFDRLVHEAITYYSY